MCKIDPRSQRVSIYNHEEWIYNFFHPFTDLSLLILECPSVMVCFCHVDTSKYVWKEGILVIEPIPLKFTEIKFVLYDRCGRTQSTVSSVTAGWVILGHLPLSQLQFCLWVFTLNSCLDLTQWQTVNCKLNETYTLQINVWVLWSSWHGKDMTPETRGRPENTDRKGGGD